VRYRTSPAVPVQRLIEKQLLGHQKAAFHLGLIVGKRVIENREP
jgi:hypothetical protein